MIEQPPRDSDGIVIPHDHPGIADTGEVIRRISREYVVVTSEGRQKISSMAYQASTKRNGGMSVDIRQLIEGDGKNAVGWVSSPPWIGSVVFRVSVLRQMDFKVGYHPISENNVMGIPANPYHGEVWGSFTGGVKKRLKEVARWFVPIDGVDLY